MWYDNSTGSLNFGMGGGNITQQVGEELFIYGKASAAITDSPLQIIRHTGTVGASGVITFAPTIAGITNANDIIGVATESLALNAFGRVTTYGLVRGITTNGTAFGETWADDDVIWYNPVTGNPTKVEPVAPYIKMQIGLVVNAGSGGSGSFQVGLQRGSTLGGTDSNVQFGTLANNNLIAYDSTLGYWKNVTSSTLGFVTSVTGTSPVVSSGGTTPAISLAASYGDTQNPYASKTANYFLAAPNGSAGVPTFRAVVAADIPTLNQNTTGTASNVTGIVAVANGGSGTATPALVAGTNVTITGSWPNQTINSSNPGGTVTAVSVTSANGFAGTSSGGATPALTLSTTITGVLKGNATAISAATSGTDYSAGTSALATGILKSTTTTGALSIAVAADFPTLNQNTTGSAATLTTARAIYGNNFDGSAALTQIIASTYGGTGNGFTKFSGATTAEKTYSLPDASTTILTTNAAVTIAQGGTGQTTQASAFNALSPITLTGDLILGNGANSATRLAIGANGYVLTSNGTTASWAAGGGSGATITNDTTTATNVYPLFANATSGSLGTAYTSNANYLYKPSTGELTAIAHVSSNGIQVNANTVATSYTIATGNNGLSAGPVSVNSGITVTVSSGSTWSVV
jgi:hypothetical protein